MYKGERLLTKYWSVILIVLFIASTLLFLIIKKDAIYVNPNDILDSNIMWSKVKRDVLFSGKYGEAHVPFLRGDETLDKLLKVSLSPVDIIYCLLPPFWAYVFCFYARILMSGLGWYIMAKNILTEIQMKKYFNTVVFCGFLYGIIPIWPVGSGTFGFAFLPWVLTDFILIYRTGKFRYCFGVIAFPFFAGLALFGIFICGYLLIFIIYDAIKHKRINTKMLFAFFLLCAIYFFRERVNITQVSTGSTIYDSAKRGASQSAGEFISTFFHLLENGRYHSGDCHLYIVFPVCIIGVLIVNIMHIKNRDSIGDILLDSPNLLILWIILNVLINALWSDNNIVNTICKIIPLLKGLNLSRTLWFTPFAWYLCFFILMIRLKEHCFFYMADVLCLCAFCAICFMGASNSLSVLYNDISTNLEYALHEWTTGEKPDCLTWREFYSEALFEDIKTEIDYKGEWSVAFGFHPAILNYNGINTLDGYYSGYSRQYKEQFAELISPYLESDSDKVDYFNNYGIRAYIFCDEVDYDEVGRNLNVSSSEMLINPSVFQEMGGVYVFSRVQIANFQKLGFEFIKCFMDEDSPYEIYVYGMGS